MPELGSAGGAPTRVSGIGSWPGTNSREAIRTVRDLLVNEIGIPYLPEVPRRGPGADMVGRGAALLVEMSTELTPSGWRIALGSGREMRRAQAYWREDLDQLAEAFEGYTGVIKTQIIGPWTLSAALELPRGEKVVSDLGAVRDVVQSLRAGVSAHIADVRRLLPDASCIVQIDEPSLPAVLAGSIASASKLRRYAPVDEGIVKDTLRHDVEALHAQGVEVVVHCCAPAAPLGLVRVSGADGLALDLSLVSQGDFDGLGEALDAGMTVWAGAIGTSGGAPTAHQAAENVTRLLDRIGFGAAALGQVVVTPACGLGFASATDAIARQRLAVDVANKLNDER